MNEEQARVIDELQAQGYAIAVWSPEELDGVDPRHLEEFCYEHGEAYINAAVD